jgi:sec-independent protein translocase protein TatA
MIGINQDLIVILAIAAFLFGAKKLPEIGKGLGKGIKEFKSGLTGSTDGEVKTHPLPSEKVETNQG